jgi:uncharacterized protein (DUF2062 family)
MLNIKKMIRLRIKAKRFIVRPELTRPQIAASFGLGLSISMWPVLGTQIWIALLLACTIKKIHGPLMIAVSFLNNPGTMVPIIIAQIFLGTFATTGKWKLAIPDAFWRSDQWATMGLWEKTQAAYTGLKPIMGQYLVGSLIAMLLTFVLGYLVMSAAYPILQKRRLARTL